MTVMKELRITNYDYKKRLKINSQMYDNTKIIR